MRLFLMCFEGRVESIYDCILPVEDFSDEQAIETLKQINKYNMEGQHDLADEGIMLGGFELIIGIPVDIC